MIKNNITSDSLNQIPKAMHALSGPATPERLLKIASRPHDPTRTTDQITKKLPQDLLASDKALLDSLKKLSEGAVVICAGQQPSLFGGTFLSLYKAATAVQLSNFLNDQGVNAVPLFWNASEDHDFNEANQLYLPPTSSEQESRQCSLNPRTDLQSLSKTLITQEDHDYIKSLVDQRQQDLKYVPEIGQSIGTWNTRLMLSFTKNTGLIVCEPEWFSDYLIPFRQKLTTNLSQLLVELTRQTTDLKNHNYQTPIRFDSTQESMLFLHLDNQRTKIKRMVSGNFSVGNQHWNLTQLQDQIERQPSAFTSSALSRPLAQQFLFPVAAQISGPTESAYLAQLRNLYELMDVPNPIIWPRSTCLLMGQEERELSELLGIKMSDLLSELLPQKIQPSPDDENLLDRIDHTLRASLLELDKYKDANSKSEFMRFRTEVYSLWRSAKKKSNQTQRKELKPKSQALHRLRQLVKPRGISQERAYGPFGLGLPVNADFFHLLCKKIDPFQTKRQIIHF